MGKLIRQAKGCQPQDFDLELKREEPEPKTESDTSILHAMRQSLETIGRLGSLQEEEFELPEGLVMECPPSSHSIREVPNRESRDQDLNPSTVGLKSIFPRHHVALRSRFGCWLNHHQGGPARVGEALAADSLLIPDRRVLADPAGDGGEGWVEWCVT